MMLTVYWCSRTTREEIKKIRERFGITAGTTINDSFIIDCHAFGRVG